MTIALTQTRDSGGRLSVARIVSAGLVQTKGLTVPLCSRMERRMASWRSETDLKTPLRMRLRVMMKKKPSTALSQEAGVGVKWKIQRG